MCTGRALCRVCQSNNAQVLQQKALPTSCTAESIAAPSCLCAGRLAAPCGVSLPKSKALPNGLPAQASHQEAAHWLRAVVRQIPRVSQLDFKYSLDCKNARREQASPRWLSHSPRVDRASIVPGVRIIQNDRPVILQDYQRAPSCSYSRLTFP